MEPLPKCALTFTMHYDLAQNIESPSSSMGVMVQRDCCTAFVDSMDTDLFNVSAPSPMRIQHFPRGGRGLRLKDSSTEIYTKLRVCGVAIFITYRLRFLNEPQNLSLHTFPSSFHSLFIHLSLKH